MDCWSGKSRVGWLAWIYRAAGAAAYLGLGVTWAMGFLIGSHADGGYKGGHATRAAMPVSLFEISGVVPLSQTIFLGQSGVTAAVLIRSVGRGSVLSAPSPTNGPDHGGL